MDIGGFTSLACSMSTLAEGIIAMICAAAILIFFVKVKGNKTVNA